MNSLHFLWVDRCMGHRCAIFSVVEVRQISSTIQENDNRILVELLATIVLSRQETKVGKRS